MNSEIIILNLMSLLYVVVMIVGCFQVPEEAKTKTRHFIICLWVTLIGLALETAADLLEGEADKTGLLMACNFIPLWILDILTYYYSLYIRDLIADKTNRYKKFTSVLMGMSVVDFILVAVIFFSGHLFTIENGYFVEGRLMQLRMILPGIILLCLFVFFIIHYKLIGIKSFWLTILFMGIPTGMTLINDVYAKSRFTYSATAASMFVVYVVLQSRVMVDADVRSQVLNRKSISDSLTGLKNRRGYQSIIDSLKDDERVVAVFCDANGLKAINDNAGHQAGDEFIKKIAGILKDTFSDGEICRISGDEFVVILTGVDETKISVRMNYFGEVLFKEGRIASYGYEIGDGKDILELVRSAEKKMYADKEKYYKETGKDRRK
ncbi:MAG: GGDEF domain-containing protein [Lachnospiraceae bacterium]|nr:GGDEF domain-containing protein [Lachnospiraceae bacterium]